MDTQNMVYPYSGVLWDLKRKEFWPCYKRINPEDITLSKISQTQKDKYRRFHSSEAPGVVKFLEKVERGVPGAGGGGLGS